MARIGRFLKASSRDMVLAGRIGTGFALASPETNGAQAQEFRQRVLREFAGLDGGQFREATNLQLHIGVATFPDDGASSVFLFDAAIRAVAASRRARMTEALENPQGTLGSPEIDPAPFVFQSSLMKDLLGQIARVANSNASVLVLGETGAGKEVVAELLHRFSDRSHKSLVAINCSAVPENLLEAELFGYERGAFTGALRAKPGQFELADGGTLFLDEVGDLPLALQSKLLRVLHDRLVVRLGARKGTEVDVRIVAATNRDLIAMMEQGQFRADLYFRLKVVTLSVPPLRERRDDLPQLVDLFVRQFNAESGRPPKTLAPATLDALHGYDWPGNVRELRNVIQRALLMSEGDVVLPGSLEFERKRSESGRREPRSPGASGTGAPEDAAANLESKSDPGPDGLNERQRRFLEALARGGADRVVRSRDYFEVTGVTSRTGLRDLQDLVARGFLVRDGRRRGAAYRLPTSKPSQDPVSQDPPAVV
jgi:transcriptional regulator with GAF, ATPase, and Fis domain